LVKNLKIWLKVLKDHVKFLKVWLKVLKGHVKFLKVWLKSVKKGQNPKSHVLMVLKSWSKKVTFRMVFFKKSCN